MYRLCASILVTCLLLVTSACHKSSTGVLAPNVVGYTVVAATAKLKLSGLVLGTDTTASSATVPAGEIISQSPLPGYSVSNGSAINVVVSTGPAAAAAPASTGAATTDSAAAAALVARTQGLSVAPVAAGLAPVTAGLAPGADGNFYGISAHGGANHDQGAFFRVTPGGVRTVLYSFGAQRDDAIQPDAALIQAADGNFYGTSAAGGTYGAGTVFRITPAGVETVLYAFPGGTGGEPANPTGGLILGSDGSFYGATRTGGANDTGVVFRLTPAGALSVLYSFAEAAH